MDSYQYWRYSLACPNDNQLSYLGSLEIGWSTLSAKQSSASMRECGPYYPDEKEIELLSVKVAQVEKYSKEEERRHLLLLKKYNCLTSNVSGDGNRTCSICGSRFKRGIFCRKLNSTECHDCKLLVCDKCTRHYTLKMGSVELCVLCHDKRELWKKTGAWYNMDDALFQFSNDLIADRLWELECDLLGGRNTPDGGNEEVQIALHHSAEDILMTPTPITDSPTKGLYIGRESKVHTLDSPLRPRNYHFKRQLSRSLPTLNITTEASPIFEASIESPTSSNDSSLVAKHENPRPELNHARGMSLNLSTATLKEIMIENSRERKSSGARAVDRLLGGRKKYPSFNGGYQSKEGSENSSHEEEEKPFIKHRPSQTLQCKVNGSKRSSIRNFKKKADNFLRPFSPDIRQREDTPDRCQPSCIEFSMTYNKATMELKVTVIGCMNLPAADPNGQSDPYVNIYLSSGEYTKQTTKTIETCLNPEYNETFEFQGISESFIRRNELIFVVYDYDRVGKDDFLGAASIPIRRVKHELDKFCLQLTDNYPVYAKKSKITNDYGQALISVMFSSDNQIVVELEKAVRLRPPKNKKLTANPCAKLILRGNESFELSKKSSVQCVTLNPQFNEELIFPLEGKQLLTGSLRLIMLHKSRTRKKHTPMGEANITDLLMKAIENKNQRYQEWIQLRAPEKD